MSRHLITRSAAVAMAVAMLFGSVATAFATVSTDQYNYNYGDTVQITGDGMQAGESVSVDVNYPDGTLAQEHQVQADDNGNFSDSFYLADGMPPGFYTVVATGQSSGNVYTTEFDPPNPSYSATLTSPLAASPATVDYSDVLTVSGTATCTNGTTTACPSGTQNIPVSLQLQSGVAPFTTYQTVLSTTVAVTWSSGVGQNWSFNWQVGKYGGGQVPPDTYDVRVVIQPSGGPPNVNVPGGNDGQDALTITKENTSTAYGGATVAKAGTSLAAVATVADEDSSKFLNDSIFAGTVAFALKDSLSNTVASGSDTSLTWDGVTGKWDASASISLGSVAAGTYTMDTTFTPSAASPATSSYYNGSSDSGDVVCLYSLSLGNASADYSDYTHFTGTITGGASPCNDISSKGVTIKVDTDDDGDFSDEASYASGTTDGSGNYDITSPQLALNPSASNTGGTGVYAVMAAITVGGVEITTDPTLTVDKEDTTTTWTGSANSGSPSSSFAVSANVADSDGGAGANNGVFSPDPNLAGTSKVTFELFQSDDTTSTGISTTVNIDSSGDASGSITLPSAAGTYRLHISYAGNDFYKSSSLASSVTITVVPPYVATGFYSPVSSDNKAKAGQGVALKWNLYLGSISLGNEIIDPVLGSGHYSIGSAVISCGAVDDPTTLDPTGDAGTSGLRYDYFTVPTATASGQNVYVWQTSKQWAGTCRRIIVSYNNTKILSADFQFTR